MSPLSLFCSASRLPFHRCATLRWESLPYFRLLSSPQRLNVKGVAFGVADGVGGWVDSGVDPSLFAQALMYYSHNYSRDSWAGEPEVDPTQDHDHYKDIQGREITPYACLDLAYRQVLRQQLVEAGALIPSPVVSPILLYLAQDLVLLAC